MGVPASNMLQSALSSYTYPYNYRARDFFDRGVQSNVNQAVNQYYSSYQAQQQTRTQPRAQPQPQQSQSRPTFTSHPPSRQSQNRWASSMNRAPQQQPSNPRSASQGRPTQDSRMMRGGGGYTNSSRGRSGYANGNMNMNGNMNGGMRQNQNRYSASNGGPPNSYGSRAPSRPMNGTPTSRDRETGQYVPTMYVKKAQMESSEDTKAKESSEAKDKEPSEESDEEDLESIKSQFQLLMEKNIKANSERREKERAQSLLEEDTKNKDGDEAKESGSDVCVAVDAAAKGDSKGRGKGNYGSYGTTFDRHNVCWEFNTFVGCRKGSACKWAHQYLAKESAHPYTGEKLNGMAVRRFRKSNNL